MKRNTIFLLMSVIVLAFFSGCNPEEVKEEGILINSVRWATCNVGTHGQFVANPEDFGGYYQWGRKGDGHEQPTSDTTGTLSTTNTPSHGNFILNHDEPYDWRTPQNDNLWGIVKTANDPCPAGWRVPTQDEYTSLVHSKSSWGELNGVVGRFFGSGEQKLFLPAAGRRNYNNGSLGNTGTDGAYWSITSYEIYAYYLNFNNGSIYSSYHNSRAYGFSVRCVKEK